MTASTDIESILDAWLNDGRDVLPERSIHAVLVAVQKTSQRGAWRVPWRVPDLNGGLRFAAVAAVAIIAVLTTGAFLYWLGANLPATNGPGLPTGPPPATPAPTVGPSSSPTPSPVATAAASTGGSISLRFSHVEPVGEGFTIRDASILVMAPDGSGSRVVDGAVGFSEECHTLLPSGTQLAYWSREAEQAGVLTVRDLAGLPAGWRPDVTPPPSSVVRVIPDWGQKWMTGFAWSPDGTRVSRLHRPAPEGAPSEDSIYELQMVSVVDGTEIRIADLRGAVGIAWSHDGRHVAFGRSDGTNVTVDIADVDGTNRHTVGTYPSGESLDVMKADLALSPDGTQLAYASRYGLHLSATDGSVGHDTEPRGPHASAPAWSADGSLVAYLSDERLMIVDPRGSGATELAKAVESFAWSPEGSRIAFVSDGLLRVSGPHGQMDGSQTEIAGGSMSSSPFAWSPDGKELAVVRPLSSERDPFMRTWAVEVAAADGSSLPVRVSDLGSPARGPVDCLRWRSVQP